MHHVFCYKFLQTLLLEACSSVGKSMGQCVWVRVSRKKCCRVRYSSKWGLRVCAAISLCIWKRVHFAVFTLPLAGFIPWCQILTERVETGRKKTSGQKELQTGESTLWPLADLLPRRQ